VQGHSDTTYIMAIGLLRRREASWKSMSNNAKALGVSEKDDLCRHGGYEPAAEGLSSRAPSVSMFLH
jgi:hypothetical protein